MTAYFCWQFINMSGSLLAEPGASAIAVVNGTSLAALAFNMLLPVVIAVMALHVGPQQAKHARVALCLGAGALTLAGVLLSFVCALNEGAAAGLATAAKILTVFSVVFMLLWGDVLCRLSARELLPCLAVSHLLAFALAILVTVCPAPIQAVLYCAFIPVTTACLLAAEREDAPAAPLPKPAHAVPMRLFLGLGLFGILIAYLTFFSEAKTPEPDELRSLIAGVVVSGVLLLVVVAFPKRVDVSFSARIILPALVVCFFFIFMFDTGQPVIEVYLAGCTWVYFRLFHWLMLCLGSMRSSWPPLAVFSVGQAIYAACTLAGNVAYDLIEAAGASPMVILCGIVVVAILVANFLLNERSLSYFDDELETGAKPTPRPFDIDDASLCRYCAERASDEFGLTAQEQKVCQLVVSGKANEEICEELHVAQSTLGVHLRNIYRKAQVHSRRELETLLRTLAG